MLSVVASSNVKQRQATSPLSAFDIWYVVTDTYITTVMKPSDDEVVLACSRRYGRTERSRQHRDGQLCRKVALLKSHIRGAIAVFISDGFAVAQSLFW